MSGMEADAWRGAVAKFGIPPNLDSPVLKEESGKRQEFLKLGGPKSTKMISSDLCSEMSL